MTTESAKAAKARYDAKTARYVSLKLNVNTDADIIRKLESQESIQGYIKNLIREDMKGEGTMNYITIESFGSDVPENWEEIAAELNEIIDERGIADDHDAVNELWDEYWLNH